MTTDTRIRTARRVLALSTATALALGLAACSTDAPTTNADGTTTVEWWSWNPDETTAGPWIEAFEAEHPDISVEHRFIQYSDYVNAVRLAATSDSGPDVFGVQVGALTTQFAPLTADLAPLAEKGLGAGWQDLLLETDQLAVDGEQVALPWMITAGGLLWYNKTLLDQAGATAPTTLAEWKDVCAKVEAIGKTCFVQGGADDWANIDVFHALADQVAPGLFSEALRGEESFDGPDMIAALEAWKRLFDDGVVQAGALGQTQYPDANDAFLKGEAAMIALGTWNSDRMSAATLETLTATYGEQVASQVFLPVPFPDVVGGAEETGRLFGGPDVGWAVSAKSEVQDAAFTLVQWLTASTTAQTRIADTLQTPALASVPVDTEGLVAPELQKPALEGAAEQLADLSGARQIQDSDVETALGQALSAVASGQSSAEDAAASVQRAVDALDR
ncbi:ABC transporter substrate-binding protein [Rathayibacter sp. Leaf296]|uniref:ABC transporter substrate-binding protein n=1 Tax=Rathayibacter sp. Leaf296 TaxID=1736327 RepID=UPI0007035DC7|nr:ABC transporter substrate-binding protein [Rathayibacter sp. Leaf296]KQQ07350.1 hypothetical protein ASF46_16890 [Rathayibacter sp. Leaf296]